MTPLVNFLAQYLGKAGTGDTPENKGQCVGLVEAWLDANARPHIWGNAKDLLANADLTVYRVYKNTPTNFPVWGDVLVWDGTWGNGDGHTGVVVAATPMLLAVFEANNPEGHAPQILMHDYTGVAGWIRLPRGDA
jgi:CHAP domain